jgi:hypothetical protein
MLLPLRSAPKRTESEVDIVKGMPVFFVAIFNVSQRLKSSGRKQESCCNN